MNAPPVQLHCSPSGSQPRQAGTGQAKVRPDITLMVPTSLPHPYVISPSGNKLILLCVAYSALLSARLYQPYLLAFGLSAFLYLSAPSWAGLGRS